MRFEEALILLRNGSAVRREGWADPQYLLLSEEITADTVQPVDGGGFLERVIVEVSPQHIRIVDAVRGDIGWPASLPTRDLLAEDWTEADV